MRRIVSATQRNRWRSELKAAGLKCTEQRLAVLAELEAADAPLTHREMHERLADLAWDQATTFRNLSDLCQAGLVTRIDAGDHVWRFELRRGDGKQAQDHGHFLCTECGQITCLPGASVSKAVKRGGPLAGIGRIREVLFKGLCSGCVSVEGQPK